MAENLRAFILAEVDEVIARECDLEMWTGSLEVACRIRERVRALGEQSGGSTPPASREWRVSFSWGQVINYGSAAEAREMAAQFGVAAESRSTGEWVKDTLDADEDMVVSRDPDVDFVAMDRDLFQAVTPAAVAPDRAALAMRLRARAMKAELRERPGFDFRFPPALDVFDQMRNVLAASDLAAEERGPRG